MRIPDYSFARTTVLLSLLAVILGLAILAAPSSGLAQNGISGGAIPAKSINHGSYAILAVEAAATQGAGQTAPPSQASPTLQAPASGAASATTPGQPIKVELPEGDGKALATEFCQDCHRLTNLTKSHKSQDDWAETVQTMMDRGSRLPPDSVDTLVKYLAKNFPPKIDTPAGDVEAAAAPTPAPTLADASAATAPGVAAPAKKVELPDGDGKAIADANCQACHKLTNLVKAHKSLDEWHDTVQLMMDRGANVQADQMDTLVRYLAKNFGPLPADAGTGAPSAGAPVSTSSPSN